MKTTCISCQSLPNKSHSYGGWRSSLVNYLFLRWKKQKLDASCNEDNKEPEQEEEIQLRFAQKANTQTKYRFSTVHTCVDKTFWYFTWESVASFATNNEVLTETLKQIYFRV